MRRISPVNKKQLPLRVIGASSLSRSDFANPALLIDDNTGAQQDAFCTRCPEQKCFSRKFEGRDIPTCPVGAIREVEGSAAIEITSDCISCGACVVMCPIGAIYMPENSQALVNQTKSLQGVVECSKTEYSQWYSNIVTRTRPTEQVCKDFGRTVSSRLEAEKAAVIYPLVATYLSAVGLPATASNQGDTSSRADVQIRISQGTIPVEVKSFTEVDIINLKSIQQALENKLSTSRQMEREELDWLPTLAIGFRYPPDRTGIRELVDDIYSSFGISIGMLTLARLVSMSALTYENETAPTSEEILTKRGMI